MITMFGASLWLACNGSLSHYGDGDGAKQLQYRIDALSILDRTDTDGDGVVDNRLPAALDGVAAALPDQGFDVAALNARIADTIAARTPLFVDLTVTGTDVRIGVNAGTFGEAGATPPPFGVVPPTLAGAIDEAGQYEVGPGDVIVPVAVHDTLPPVPFLLADAHVVGWADTLGMAGEVAALIPVDALVADVIEPSIPAEGWDLDWDGVPEPREEVLALIEELAPLAADTALPSGAPAVSAALTFSAAIDDPGGA